MLPISSTLPSSVLTIVASSVEAELTSCMVSTAMAVICLPLSAISIASAEDSDAVVAFFAISTMVWCISSDAAAIWWACPDWFLAPSDVCSALARMMSTDETTSPTADMMLVIMPLYDSIILFMLRASVPISSLDVASISTRRSPPARRLP